MKFIKKDLLDRDLGWRFVHGMWLTFVQRKIQFTLLFVLCYSTPSHIKFQTSEVQHSLHYLYSSLYISTHPYTMCNLCCSTLWNWSNQGKQSASVGSWHSTYRPHAVLSGMQHNTLRYLHFTSFFLLFQCKICREPLQDSRGCLHGRLPHRVRLRPGQNRVRRIGLRSREHYDVSEGFHVS